MKRILFIFVTLISILVITNKVNASEAKCIYPLNSLEKANYFTVTIKDNKISVEYNVKSSVIVTSNLTVNDFINSNYQLECLDKITYNSFSDRAGLTFRISRSSGTNNIELDSSKSSVTNDEKTLLNCSYNGGNLLIKTNKSIKFNLLLGNMVTKNEIGYDDIGNTCPSKIYLEEIGPFSYKASLTGFGYQKPITYSLNSGTKEENEILLQCNYNGHVLFKTNKEIGYILKDGWKVKESTIKYEDIGDTCPDKIYLQFIGGINEYKISIKGTDLINPTEYSLGSNSNIGDKIETNDSFWGNLPVIKCGDISIPEPIPPITRTIVMIIKIAAPLVLIIMGMIDMIMAVTANDEKKIKEAQSKLPRRLIPAALIFLVVTIVQLIIGILANNSAESTSLTNCVNCLISDESKCGAAINSD